MSVSVEDAADFLGFPPGGYEYAWVDRVLGSAVAAIGAHLVAAPPPSSDQEQALDLATLRMVAELWAWQNTPTGQQVFADGSTMPSPVLRDAYWAVKPLLVHAGLVASGVAFA